MTIRSLIQVCTIALLFCEVEAQQFSLKDYTILNGIEGEKLIKQCSRSSPENIEGFFKLSERDIDVVSEHFERIYKLRSRQCCNAKGRVVRVGRVGNLEEYIFQFTGVIIKEKKHLYINAFDREELDFILKDYDWHKIAVIICDGGPSYWGVLFNLEKKKFHKLAMNGGA